jgi:hypothetical protein
MPVGMVNLAGARPDNLALVSIRGSVQAEWSMVRVCVWSPREERDLLAGGARFRWEGTHERVVIPIRRRSGRPTGRRAQAQPSLSPPICRFLPWLQFLSLSTLAAVPVFCSAIVFAP